MNITNLLSKLISFKTVYPNYEEVEKCINFIKEYFKDSNLYIEEFSKNKDKSILISNTEDKRLDVLFVGHLDVVPEEAEDQFTAQIIDNKLYGRGSFDMKGHDAVMINLLKENKFNCKVGLLLTSDEERGGFNGTGSFLNDEKYTCKIAVVPDAGNNFEIVDEEKGVLQIRVSYEGKESHSAQIYNGDNAIKKIMDLYEYLIEKYPLTKSKEDFISSINVAKIEGGRETNIVAGKCSMILDIRHIAKDKKSDFINAIKEYNNKYKIEILAEGEEFKTIKEDKYFKKFLIAYKQVLKKDVKYSKCESASDGRFFYSKNIPCILMNATGENLHSKDEYIELDSLDTLYNIYLQFMKEVEK